MWPTLRERLHDWYILIVALCLIVAGSIFASYENAKPPAPATLENGQKAETSPKKEPSPKKSVAQNPATPAASQSPKPPAPSTPTPSTKATAESPSNNSSQQVASPAPASAQHSTASHETHTAQSQPTQASGQAANPFSVEAGDAAAGRQVFRKCQACHSLEPGKNVLGPSLAGVLGRKSGSVEGYNYSPAMKQANLVWDQKTIDAYLADPGKTVPGEQDAIPWSKNGS
jgi:nitrite reductase (NO-forming)